MKTFNVILTRDITESVAVSVTAKDADEAERKALALPQDTLNFVNDDNCPDDEVYVTGCDEE